MYQQLENAPSHHTFQYLSKSQCHNLPYPSGSDLWCCAAVDNSWLSFQRGLWMRFSCGRRLPSKFFWKRKRSSISSVFKRPFKNRLTSFQIQVDQWLAISGNPFALMNGSSELRSVNQMREIYWSVLTPPNPTALGYGHEYTKCKKTSWFASLPWLIFLDQDVLKSIRICSVFWCSSSLQFMCVTQLFWCVCGT